MSDRLVEFVVVFRPAAEQDLESLRWFLRGVTYESRAELVVEQMLEFCLTLAFFPYRGREREDIYPGLRILGHKGQVVAFLIDSSRRIVVIARILSARSDYASVLRGWNR